MSSIISTTPTIELKQRIGRLAQHRPYGDGHLTVEFVRRRLVLAAALEAGDEGFASLADCREACSALWGLDLDIDELRSVVDSLMAAKQLERRSEGYALTAAARSELNRVVDESSRTQTTALAEWEMAVRAVASELDTEAISLLREDLMAWLQRIIVHYGVEAALILYPEEERARRFYADVEELGFDFLPRRGKALMKVRPSALHLFIRHPTAAQRTYIANLMTTAYMTAVFTLDSDGQRLVEEITRGQRVYLDTNMLYSALNLNGPSAYLSTKRALDMTRDLGFELAVTPWTITEMKESIRRGREELAKSALPPRALAEIAAEAGGEGAFITAYWRKYKETGVTPQDFCDLHEQVDGLLAKLGIAVIDEGCAAVDRDRDAINEQMSLIGRVRGGEAKSDRVREHDVKHRLLIEKLRGAHHRTFSNAGYWFLTRDGVLVPYGLADRATDDRLPFAVSLTAWVHIVRGLRARTADYEQTLVDLLDTPSLRPRGGINPQTIAEVLGRVDLMVADSTEEVATRVMLDSAAMVEIQARPAGERAARIDALVTEKSREMESQLDEARRQLDAERNARAAAEADAQNAVSQTAVERDRAERALREEVDKALGELSGQAQQHREAVQRAQRDAAAANTRANAAERRHKRLKRRISRIGAVVIGLMGIAVIAVPWLADWLSGWSLVGSIIAGGSMVALGVWLGVHSTAAKRIVAIAATLLSAGTAVHEIVAPSPASPSHTRSASNHR